MPFRRSVGRTGQSRQNDERVKKPGSYIGQSDKQAKNSGVCHDEGERNYGEKKYAPEWMGLEYAKLLERRVADIAYHQKTDTSCIHQAENRQGPIHDFARKDIQKEHQTGEGAARGRAGEAGKETLVADACRHIEAGQPQSGAYSEEEGYGDAELSELLQSKSIHQHGRADTERDEIGQRVKLDAEFGGRAGQSGDFSVYAVHEQAYHDGHGRAVIQSLRRPKDAHKPEKHAGSREKIGQNVKAFMARNASFHAIPPMEKVDAPKPDAHEKEYEKSGSDAETYPDFLRLRPVSKEGKSQDMRVMSICTEFG